MVWQLYNMPSSSKYSHRKLQFLEALQRLLHDYAKSRRGKSKVLETRVLCCSLFWILDITQRAQYPLIKEYTVNYKGLHIMI